MKLTNTVHYLILLALLALLQGCGFHLRGSGTTDANLPADISPLLIQGLGQHDFLKLELENQLVNSGVQVTDNATDAASVLRIINRQSDRRVETVDSRGKVLEYSLRETLSFELVDRAGNARVPTQSLDLTRIYAYEQQVLGSKQEESFLRNDMWRHMTYQILTRLSRQLR